LLQEERNFFRRRRCQTQRRKLGATHEDELEGLSHKDAESMALTQEQLDTLELTAQVYISTQSILFNLPLNFFRPFAAQQITDTQLVFARFDSICNYNLRSVQMAVPFFVGTLLFHLFIL